MVELCTVTKNLHLRDRFREDWAKYLIIRQQRQRMEPNLGIQWNYAPGEMCGEQKSELNCVPCTVQRPNSKPQ